LNNYEKSKEPLITIGMLVKNRESCIREILKVSENLEYPREKMKLVFVDDYPPTEDTPGKEPMHQQHKQRPHPFLE
jgi:hypothetical protein